MPIERKPQRITDHAHKLLNALEKRRNQWLTRLDIAHLIGKKRLTPYDIDLLHLLAETGHIRVQQTEGYSREGYRWEYGVFDTD
jgi:hypothetical protein